MRIRFDKKQSEEKVADFLPRFFRELETGPFRAEIETEKYEIKIHTVRLRESKPYCGNHAGPCKITTGKKKKSTWLEGGDWILFNDLLNDICDDLDLSANIDSSVCVVRLGKERRIDYNSGQQGEEWKRMGVFENWCGRKAPRSDYPQGTPGSISQWIERRSSKPQI